MLAIVLVCAVRGLEPVDQKIKATVVSTEFKEKAFTGSAFECTTCWFAAAIHMTGTSGAENPRMLIASCVFRDNSITASDWDTSEACGGGAVYCNNIALDCEHTEFTRCKALIGNGGAIYADVSAPVMVLSCTFTDCTTEDKDKSRYSRGGALYSKQEMVNVSQSKFVDCRAGKNGVTAAGGAIYGLNIECSTSNFSSCRAQSPGGAIALGDYNPGLYGSAIVCRECRFEGCYAGDDGGAVMIAAKTGTTGTFRDCQITLCEAVWGTGGIGFRGGCQDGSLVLESCVFRHCAADAENGFSGAIRVFVTDPSNYVYNLMSCTFHNASSGSEFTSIYFDFSDNVTVPAPKSQITGCAFVEQTGYCIVHNTAYNSEWVLDDCSFIRNQVTKGDGLISITTCSSYLYWNCRFESNTIADNWQYPVVPFVNEGVHSFSGCSFVGWNSRYPVLNVRTDQKITPRNISLYSCHFESCISTEVPGILGNIPATCPVSVLKTSFVNCSGKGYLLKLDIDSVLFNANVFDLHLASELQNCIILKLSDSDISFEDSVFSNTGQATTGLFLNIASQFSSLLFRNCSFCGLKAVGNDGGIDYNIGLDGRIEFMNCSFLEIECKGTISDVQGPGTGTTVFSDCIFDSYSCDNSYSHILGSYFPEYGNLTLINSRFTACTGMLMNLEFNRSTVIIQNVNWEQCESDTSNLVSILQKSTEASSYLTLSNCTFTECHAGMSSSATSGLILSNAASGTSVLSVVCDYVTFTTGTFQGCTSSSGRLIIIECKYLEMADNNISSAKAGQESAVAVRLTAGETIFENTLFHVLVTTTDVTPLFDLSCGSDASIQFHNCCFTHATEGAGAVTSGPLYLKMNVAGEVLFSEVCFDIEESKAILIESTTDSNITFNGTKEDFFGDNCGCWGLLPSTPPEPNNNKIGLIVGIVVGVIVVVALVVFLVVFFIRRKKKMPSTTDDEDAQEELTEETTTTIITTELETGPLPYETTGNTVFIPNNEIGDMFRPGEFEETFDV